MFAICQENLLGYAITMIVGSAAALGLGWYRSAKAGIKQSRIILATLLLPLFTAFFSHLFYCLVDLEYTIYSYSVGYLFAFWERGGMVYGGMLGAALALWAAGGKDGLKMLEHYAPSGAWMIAAARIAEGFMGQGYGEYYADAPFFCRFPFMVYDASYEEWGWALFVLEALIALVLMIVVLKKKTHGHGDSVLLLLGLYASAQIVLESLRRDEFLRWGFVRVEEVLSAVVILFVLVCYCAQSTRGKRAAKFACFSLYALMISACLLLEFATEGRIPFLTFLSVGGCYLAMTCACMALAGSVLWMRHLGDHNMQLEKMKDACE